MTGKQAISHFKKYTVQPKGLGAIINRIFAVDPHRSSGVPLNPQFRNPAPGAEDPKKYDDPVTVPAGDIADNPYWKRDVRRQYPQPSVITQGDVAALLTVGNMALPKQGALKAGEEGEKQLVELKASSESTGLAGLFSQPDGQVRIKDVLRSDGLPPMPTAMGGGPDGVVQYELIPEAEQTYGEDYPCRSFK